MTTAKNRLVRLHPGNQGRLRVGSDDQIRKNHGLVRVGSHGSESQSLNMWKCNQGKPNPERPPAFEQAGMVRIPAALFITAPKSSALEYPHNVNSSKQNVKVAKAPHRRDARRSPLWLSCAQDRAHIRLLFRIIHTQLWVVELESHEK